MAMLDALKQNVGKAVLVALTAGAVLIGGALWRHEHPAEQGEGAKLTAIAQKWEFAGTGPFSGPVALADDGTVYAGSEDGYVYALDGSGNLQWKFEAGPMAGPVVIGADGAIYVTNVEQRVFAINKTGTQRWASGGGEYADRGMGEAVAAIDENHLYRPWRSQLRALRLRDGSVDWSAEPGFERSGSVSILPNGVVAYSGAGRLVTTWQEGKTVWRYPELSAPLTAEMTTKNSGRIPPGNFRVESGIAIGDLGRLYVCAADSRLVAFSSSGSYLWEFKTKNHTVNKASPVIAADGTIYFATGDGFLYALNPDGAQKWATQTGGSITATPVLAADGTIYVLNIADLVAISPEGKVLEKSAVKGGPGTSPALGADGTVYFGVRGNRILAFAGKHGGLMESAWPKFQRDLANSGRARPI